MSDTKKAPAKKTASSKAPTKAQVEAKVKALQVEVEVKDAKIVEQAQEIERLKALLAKAPRWVKNYAFPCDATPGCAGHKEERYVQMHRDQVAAKAKKDAEANSTIESAEQEENAA